MFNAGLKNIVESIVFASQEEISSKQIKEILDSFKIESKNSEIDEIIDALNQEYINNDSAFEIIKIAGGYQFATRKKFAHFIGKLYSETQRKKLSPSAIETLAIVAYKQPITRSDIEFVRGVNVDYIVNSLLERDLICIKGRASGPGRPILYGTTNNFLKVLGLNSLDDLPKLREINEILKNEKIEGITEADIDLFNSVNTESNLFSAGTPNPGGAALTETDGAEQITTEDGTQNNEESEESEIPINTETENEILEEEIENIDDEEDMNNDDDDDDDSDDDDYDNDDNDDNDDDNDDNDDDNDDNDDNDDETDEEDIDEEDIDIDELYDSDDNQDEKKNTNEIKPKEDGK